mgnify:CR=1 FL=1
MKSQIHKVHFFVQENSIVRQIWGKSDTILLIFAGASAEFALNKAVDWLYFTGRLPADPLGRLFSTVSYARMIVFSENKEALHTIERMVKIHTQVEENRAVKIPDWAYRDVLYLLVDYSIRAFELLERKLTQSEKNEVFDVFYRLGKAMRISALPETYEDWTVQRESQLSKNLHYSSYTQDLFEQYRKHLGQVRFWLLREVQKWLVPPPVNNLLGFKNRSYLLPLVSLYKLLKKIRFDKPLKALIIPPSYHREIKRLEIPLYV